MIPRYLLIGVTALLLLVISMGIYLRQMRLQAVGPESPVANALPVAPPASGPTETVTLFVADDAAGMLRARSAQIPLPGGRQQRAEELLRSLLRIYQQPGAAHPLAPTADIRSIYLVDPGAAVIDLNAAFADQHRSGILGTCGPNRAVRCDHGFAGRQSVSVLIDVIEWSPEQTLRDHRCENKFIKNNFMKIHS